MKQSAFPEDFFLHVAAALIALGFCLSSGWLLFRLPAPAPFASPMEVIYLQPVPIASQPPPQQLPIIPSQSQASNATHPVVAASKPTVTPLHLPPGQSQRPDPHSNPPINSPPLPSTSSPTPTAGSRVQYTRDGQVALPAGVAVDPMSTSNAPPGDANDRDAKRAQAIFERPNPFPPEPDSVFGGEWESDGSLGEVATKKIVTRLKRVISKLPHRKQVQEVSARPPPPVRFNPALHERPSDLGSEATGDAYKAAPIAFEKAPGLQGEASRRIRKAMSDLEARAGACDRQRLKTLMAPALVHLADLQRAEYAAARGGDPIQIEQLLPRTADMAYDQARRALWYANKQLSGCAK